MASAEMKNLTKQNAARAKHRLFSVTAHADGKCEGKKRLEASRANGSASEKPDQSFRTTRQHRRKRTCETWAIHTVVLTPFEQTDPGSHCAKGCHQRITKTSQHNTHQKNVK
jgi:hypothetical protein